jgi:PAS domain S-box-containing protein
VGRELVPILLVDDRPENLLALEAALASEDYDLVLAHSGEEALARLLEREFALILLDVAMPGLDGLETARIIRGRERTRHIPIVFVTAHMSDTTQVFSGYEHGAVDYLVKPLDTHALRTKVSVFADLYRYSREIERTAEALAQAEHRARVLSDALYDVTFEDAPIGIAHVSSDLRWMRVNARMASILRLTPQELRDRSILDVVHPADRDALALEMNRVLTGREARRRIECRMLDREGVEVWIHLTFSLIRDNDGNAVQLAIIEDITEEKRLAKALESSERRFARLRDTGPLAIYEEDADGVITNANAAFLTMVGYSEDDIAKGTLRTSSILAPESEPVDAVARDDLERAGLSPARERVFVRKDGTRGTMLAGAVRNGTIVGFALDVTTLREAEVLRARSARELEGSLRARDDFLSVLAHELRNPLTPLTMQVASLQATAAAATQPLDARWVEQQLNIVQRAVARLARLTEELLEVSRTTVGGFRLERADTDLVALTRDVVARSSEELERARCPVTIEGDPVVEGQWDRLALERVVTQLLSNAMKYGPGRPIEIVVWNDGDNATLSVRDHGIGVPPEQRERLFERFARLAPLQHYGGFGVGLWLVHRIVEAHRGQIEAADVGDGEGARFVVRLPRREERVAGEGSAVSARQGSVLLVDDDNDVREILQLTLANEGYDVRAASNGAEALTELTHGVPDVVLLDMMMPVMSGAEFLAAVRADPRYRRLPVVVVTAWPAEAKSLAGADAVLAKPVDVEVLKSTIDQVRLH